MFTTGAVVDQWALFRSGIERVYDQLEVQVVASTGRGGELRRIVRTEVTEVVIVGKLPDLTPQRLLKEMKTHNPSLKVVILLDRAEKADVARLLSGGANGLLLRSCTPEELRDAIARIHSGERVVAPSVAAGALGTVGPNVHLEPREAEDRSGLSPKELEVLSVLSEGATYEQIAQSLIISKATVKTHLVHIYKKLEVDTRDQAVARALALGLLS